MRWNRKASEQALNAVSGSLHTELGKAKQHRDATEQALQDIKSRNIMELPESKQYYLKAVKALRNQLRISQERLDRDRQTKVDLQSMAGKVAHTTDLDAPSSDPNTPSPARLQKLEATLKERLV